MTIHVGKRVSAEGWRAFESDPYLSVTRRRVYARCAPCLESLLAQLTAGAETIELGQAWDCWKITVVVPGEEDCWRFLELFEEYYPQEYVYGKFGTGSRERATRAVVFHVDTLARRDALLPKVKDCARRITDAAVQISRGCANPYERLFGPWPQWQAKMQLVCPKEAPAVVRYLRRVLYERG